MKTIRFFIIIMALFLGSGAFAQQISTAELQVNGLTCSMCSRATETSLKSLGFIESITPDLNRNIFVLAFKKGEKVNIDQIKDKVQDAGFSIGNLSATMNFGKAEANASGIVQTSEAAYKIVNAKDGVPDGTVTARVVDKDFITPSAFKKNAATIKSESYLSGRGKVNGKETRIYHLSI